LPSGIRFRRFALQQNRPRLGPWHKQWQMGWAVSNMLESTVEALAEPLVGEESSLTAQRVVSAKHTTALALLALGAVATLAWAVFLGWLVGRLFRFC